MYEHGFYAVKLPKHILNGSNWLLMGFPACGSSYFLLMQLDKDFKPLFKLLETQPDPSGKSSSSGEMNHVIRIKKIDISQMQMFEDDLNLSLVDWGKLQSLLHNAGVPIQTSEHVLLSEFALKVPCTILDVLHQVFHLLLMKCLSSRKGHRCPLSLFQISLHHIAHLVLILGLVQLTFLE